MNQKHYYYKDPLKNWIKESGHDHPSAGFSETILIAIAKQHERKSYQPVISPFAMGMISTTIISLFIYILFFFPTSEVQSFWSMNGIQLPEIRLVDFLSVIPNLSSNIIFNSSLLAFSIFAFISILFWSRRINQA